ncbi:hypothetical protein Agub_g3776, partial [Astrephomene gubernaculifera]
MLNRPGNLGLNPPQGSGSGLSNIGVPGGEDTSNLSIPALQALLRQRQLQQQQQQQQQTSFNPLPSGGIGPLGGVGMGASGGLLRPTSLQDHLTSGLGSDHNTWRPSLGALPSGTGIQGFGTGQGPLFGEPLGGFQEGTGLNNAMATGPILRPASDSLLANQRSGMMAPLGLQSMGMSSMRANSLSAQTAGTGGLGAKKSTWDAATPMVAEGSDDSSGDDSSQRRRVKGRSASTAHQPSVQEKNRSAQRRFRQRQKEKMAYLETRTEALAAQVEKLSSENESLRNMTSMLEKVLNLREEHISNLQEAAKVFSNLNIRTQEGEAGGSGGGGGGAAGGGERGAAADAALRQAASGGGAGPSSPRTGGGGGAAHNTAGGGGGGGGGGALLVKGEDGNLGTLPSPNPARTGAGGGASLEHGG